MHFNISFDAKGVTPFQDGKPCGLIGRGGYKWVWAMPDGKHVLKVFREDSSFGKLDEIDLRWDLSSLWFAHILNLPVLLPVYVNLKQRWYVQKKVSMYTGHPWDSMREHFKMPTSKYHIGDIRGANVGTDSNGNYIIVDCVGPYYRPPR